MPGKPPLYKSKRLHVTVGLLISAICMYWAIRPILKDPEGKRKIVEAFQHADYRTFPLMLATLFLFYYLKAVRWRLLLLPVGKYRPLRDLFGPIMIGFAANNVMPVRLGEFLRCLIFSRKQQLPFTISLASVVLERVFDAITVAAYLAIGLLFIDGVDPRLEEIATLFAIGGLLAVLAGLAYVIWTDRFLRVFESILGRLKFIPAGLAQKILGILTAGAQGLAALKDIRLLLGAIVISITKWGLNAFLIWVSLWSFGIVVSPLVAIVLMGIVAFAVAVPASPGFFGVIQACFTTLPVLTGRSLDPAAVFAASIYYHLGQYIPVTLTGLVYFVKSGFDLRQMNTGPASDDGTDRSRAAGSPLREGEAPAEPR